MIAFTAHGQPKGQPRPRAFARGGHAAVYDPGTAEGWKGCVAVAAREHLPEQPISEPLSVSLVFYMPRPKRLMKKRDPDDAFPCTSKPDADNLAKAVLDALTDIGMWCDDAQIARLEVVKLWAPKDGRSGVDVTIASEGRR